MGSNLFDYKILNSRRQSEELTDVILVIGDMEFSAHKVCISEYLNKHFQKA